MDPDDGDLGRLLDAGIPPLVAAVHAGEADPEELAAAAVARGEATPPATFTVLDAAVATAEARALKRRLAAGQRPPLAGVPVAHKDLLDTVGLPTTYGNPAVAGHRTAPRRDATAVVRARDAGAVQVGKTNLHELAYGITGRNPHTGDVANPAHPGRIAGGSSSGSAAAVAAGAVVASLGTDTGGSVRIPAACCGVAGVKPTRGAVSTTGVQPLSWLQDTVGTLAAAVGDSARLLAAVAGVDGMDPASRRPPPGWRDALVDSAGGAGRTNPTGNGTDVALLLPAPLWAAVDAPVADVAREAVDALVDSGVGGGVGAREVPLAGYREARTAQGRLLAAHALAVHGQRLADDPGAFGDDVRGRLRAARELTGAQVAAALRTRERWIHDLRRLLGGGSGDHPAEHQPATATFSRAVLAAPTLVVAPPPADATDVVHAAGEEDITSALTRQTGVFNLAGLPAVSVPVGLTEDGLPVALQLAGPAWSEPLLVRLATWAQSLSC